MPAELQPQRSHVLLATAFVRASGSQGMAQSVPESRCGSSDELTGRRAGTGFDVSGPGSYVEALAVLAAIVGIHEGGHFAAARLQGIHVTQFAIGFGPPILKYQVRPFAKRALCSSLGSHATLMQVHTSACKLQVIGSSTTICVKVKERPERRFQLGLQRLIVNVN